MIYLDNAATTLHKPQAVRKAVLRAMQDCGNPGRGGHPAAMEGARIVYDCRCAAAALFGLADPERVVFTQNATHALNLAIHSAVLPGMHVVTSGFEHNSVMRPLESLKACQVTYTAAFSKLFDQAEALNRMKEAVTDRTGLMICNALSNVFGNPLPYRELDAFCAEKGIPLILDFSQAAGVLELDCRQLQAAIFCCMPGHKGLYGPQGTGLLLCLPGSEARSLMQGGTGSNSLDLAQPDFLPDQLESGTLNVHGIAGLKEGIEFVRKTGTERIRQHEERLCRRLVRGLQEIPGTEVFAGPGQVSMVSFNLKGMPAEELCGKLGEQGFCLRGGLHCAPMAHRSAGTLPEGTVRASFSAFNREAEIDELVRAVKAMTKSVNTR